METFSPGDIKDELREFEERCGFFSFPRFFVSKKKTETKRLE